MIEVIVLSITSFIGTNIDDMLIDIFFFSSVSSRKDIQNIVVGKYIGIGTLILISIAGAMGLGFVPMEYVRYLGLIPIGLGIKELVCNYRKCDEEDQETEKLKSRGMAGNVALITMANGADNIGVYLPLFISFSLSEYVIFSSVFVLMIGLWCVLGYQASRLPLLKNGMNRYKSVIVPIVYIGLGIYILVKATS